MGRRRPETGCKGPLLGGQESASALAQCGPASVQSNARRSRLDAGRTRQADRVDARTGLGVREGSPEAIDRRGDTLGASAEDEARGNLLAYPELGRSLATTPDMEVAPLRGAHRVGALPFSLSAFSYSRSSSNASSNCSTTLGLRSGPARTSLRSNLLAEEIIPQAQFPSSGCEHEAPNCPTTPSTGSVPPPFSETALQVCL